MIFKSIFPIWIILILFAPLLGFIGWRIKVEYKTRSRLLAWVPRLTMVVLLLLICLRPSIAGGKSQTGSNNLDVIFVVDTTASIVAEDYQNNRPRMEGVKSDIKNLAKDLAGARFSLVTFDFSTVRQLPLTTDATALSTAINIMQQEDSSYSAGSSLDQPLDYLKKYLSDIQKAQPERGRVVFFASDGENTSNKEQKSFNELNKYIDGGAVLGYGTTEGGKMKDIDGSNYLDDYSSNKLGEAVSKIDESNLKKIAGELGVKYSHQTAPNNTGKLLGDINIKRVENQSRPVDDYFDLYWIFAILLNGLLLRELWKLLLLRRNLSNTKAGVKK